MEANVLLLIQNLVVSGRVAKRIDLRALLKAKSGWTVTYEPEQFPGAVVKRAGQVWTWLAFGSGKIVITGLRRRSDVAAAVQEITALVGSAEDKPDVRIVNCVASGKLPFLINADNFFAGKMEPGFEYNFDHPRSIVYRVPQSSVVVMVTKYGRITVVGAKTYVQMIEATSNFMSRFGPALARSTGSRYSGGPVLVEEGDSQTDGPR